jgi:hypothetical protein
MWPNIDRLGLRIVAQIQGHPSRTRLASKQERDRASAGRIVLQRFDNGAAQSRGAIFVQQFE